MLQLSALPAQSAAPAFPGIGAAHKADKGAESPENGGFAQHLEQTAPTAGQPKTDPAADPVLPAAAQTPAMSAIGTATGAATPAAETGKTLPPLAAAIAFAATGRIPAPAVVTGAAPAEAAPTTANSAPAAPLLAFAADLSAEPETPAPAEPATEGEAEAARLNNVLHPLPALLASLKPAKTAKSEDASRPADTAETNAPSDEAGTDEAQPALTAEAIALALIAPATPAAPQALVAPTEQAAPGQHQRAVAVAAKAPGEVPAQPPRAPAPQGEAVGRPPLAAAADPAQAEPVRELAVSKQSSPAQALGRSAPFTIDTAAPAPAAATVHVRPAHTDAPESLPGKSAAAAAPTSDPLAPAAAAPPVDPAATLAAPTGAAPAVSPSPSGHDFAALVDRLIAARDAARPEGVSIALQHAEFGRVSLQFRQDEQGLSVAMSAADPAFAQAVQQAIPAASASAENNSARQDNQSGQPGQPGTFVRADAAGAQGQNHNQRGQSQDQAETRAFARTAAARDQTGGSETTSEAPARGRGRFV
ncbi:flagellar hook-length control protein FliK [Novosphingobium flavum]|uniref:Flagellar hook-length control protein FliK n=1 Tax=Novosphingobium flavum TaxID=1778672 RepID=A0A7X1FS47_9SPHN|nr:flagellar hook-length control protein FliK [Novosphingobium flavum]MBC2665950.1 flagellar hook-length control protein FliK [Novosphingobium flavum]